MKKNILFEKMFFIILLISTIYGCSDMDADYKNFIKDGEIIYTGKMDSVVILSGKERVFITGVFISDPNITQCRIYWDSRTKHVDVPVERVNGVQKFKQEIPLPEKLYNFEIFTLDQNGNISVPVSASGKSYGEKFQTSITNRLITSAEMDETGSVTIGWLPIDKTLGAFATEITYVNTEEQTCKVVTSVDEEQTILPKFGDDQFSFQTLYLPDTLCVDTFRTIPAIQEVIEYESPTVDPITEATLMIADFETMGEVWDIGTIIKERGKKYYQGPSGALSAGSFKGLFRAYKPGFDPVIGVKDKVMKFDIKVKEDFKIGNYKMVAIMHDTWGWIITEGFFPLKEDGETCSTDGNWKTVTLDIPYDSFKGNGDNYGIVCDGADFDLSNILFDNFRIDKRVEKEVINFSNRAGYVWNIGNIIDDENGGKCYQGVANTPKGSGLVRDVAGDKETTPLDYTKLGSKNYYLAYEIKVLSDFALPSSYNMTWILGGWGNLLKINNGFFPTEEDGICKSTQNEWILVEHKDLALPALSEKSYWGLVSDDVNSSFDWSQVRIRNIHLRKR